MKVLIRLERFGCGLDGETLEEKARTLFETVRNIYNNCANDDEAYLIDEFSDCVFGEHEPERVIGEASAWNQRIREDFRRALAQLYAERSKNAGVLPLDNQITYELKKAAMALDNDFYSFAELATCLGEKQDYFNSVIKGEELAAIQQNPENYALIEVWPK